MTVLMTTGARRPIASLFAAALLGGVAAPGFAQDQKVMKVPTLEQATPMPQPPDRLQIVTIPTPLPLPGQLKSLATPQRPSTITNPKDRVVSANAAARIQPDRASWLNAIQQYSYADGALYQVYAAPGQVTDIVLQEGE